MMNQAAASVAGTGDTDWKMSRTGGSEGLNPGESMLLDALFWNSNEVTISQLRGTLRSTLAAASNWLRQGAIARGWLDENRAGKIAAYVVVGLVLMVAGLLLALFLGAFFKGGAWIGAAVCLVGLVWMVSSGAMARRSDRELELRRKAGAFRIYVRRLSQRPEDLARSLDLFNTYLPYAVAFGTEQQWAKAFWEAAAAPPPSMPIWYMGGTSTNLFGRFWFLPLALYESVSYVPPSTSSSTWSGGSSGGGFSSGDSGFSSGSSGGGGGSSGGGSW